MTAESGPAQNSSLGIRFSSWSVPGDRKMSRPKVPTGVPAQWRVEGTDVYKQYMPPWGQCVMNGYFRGYSDPFPRTTGSGKCQDQFLVGGSIERESELIGSLSLSNANWFREMYWLPCSEG